MILYLFNHYFNPLTITTVTEDGNDIRIWFDSDYYLTVRNAKIYDVAATINSAIEDFYKGKLCD